MQMKVGDSRELGDLLDEARETITGDRQDQYGAPENSFSIIGDYWTAYLKAKKDLLITALDVAHMMILFKVARCQGQKVSRDNYRDMAGYSSIAADRLVQEPTDLVSEYRACMTRVNGRPPLIPTQGETCSEFMARVGQGAFRDTPPIPSDCQCGGSPNGR